MKIGKELELGTLHYKSYGAGGTQKGKIRITRDEHNYLQEITYKGNMTLENSDKNNDYIIKWINFDKNLYIAKDNVLSNVCTDSLWKANLSMPKEYMVNGYKCILRVPTMEEWEKFHNLIPQNTNQFFPVINNKDGYSNFVYHHRLASSYEIDRSESSKLPSDTHYSQYVYRPVLEILNSPPLISDVDKNLGNKSSNFKISYSVSDEDNDTVKIEIKIDNDTLQTLSSINLNKNYSIDVELKNLTLGQHEIKIIATDSKGSSTTRIYTFNIVKVKYRLILDKNIDSIANKQVEIIKFNPKINNKELDINKVDKDKIIYNSDNLNADTVNLDVEGNNCILDKLSYVVY